MRWDCPKLYLGTELLKMKICVVGAGFVGLVTSVYFAEMGHDVICVDLDETKINSINKGKAHFFEAGLDQKLKKIINKNLIASTNLNKSVIKSNCIFLCVGTPTSPSGSIDLSYVAKVADQLADIIKDSREPKTFVVKSTVIPGTTRKIFIDRIANRSGKEAGKDFFVAMNPEFLREGSAVSDAFNPDRVIVGADDRFTQNEILGLYENEEHELKVSLNWHHVFSRSFSKRRFNCFNEIG